MVNFISDTNNRVDLFLKGKGITSRDGAGAGMLVSLLLPLSIVKGEFKLFFFEQYIKLWIPVSFGLLLHSILNIIYVRKSVPIFNGLALIPSMLLTFLLTYSCFNEGTVWKVILNCCLIFLYDYTVLNLMRVCPKAFTYGEACLVSQGIVLFISSCFTLTNYSSCITDATSILKVGIVCVFAISFTSFTFDLGSNPTIFFGLIVCTICFILVPILTFSVSMNPFLWIYYLVIWDWSTSILFCYWIVCSLLGVAAVIYQIRINEKANTIVRKSFHILSLIVFLPGILVNFCLMYLASGVVFALFLMADVVRLLKVPLLSGGLEEGFRVFSDDKDSGGLSLTPLYLVVGCSLPLWIHPTPSPTNLLPLVSGLLTVAIGDTAASVCGSLFGRNKWPGSKKTKEGTIACFISQLFFVITLIHFGYLPRKDLIRPVCAISVTSFVEAKTSQVDNLVLPLLMYIIVVS